MKTLCIGSNKGGVGKSNFCTQISSVFSYIGRKVLVIDCDSQHNLSSRLKLENSEYFLEDLLLGKCKIEDVLKLPYPDDEKLSNVWVIPSSFNLSMIDKEDKDFDKKYTYILKQALSEVIDTFEFCVLDTSPSPALNTNMMAYCFADYLIGIIDMSLDSVKGFQTLIDTQINPIKELVKPDLEVLGVVLNNYDGRSSYAKQFLESVQNLYGELLFKSIITASAVVPQSSAAMLPLITFEPGSKLTTQFVDLSAEILRKIKILEGGVDNG